MSAPAGWDSRKMRLARLSVVALLMAALAPLKGFLIVALLPALVIGLPVLSWAEDKALERRQGRPRRVWLMRLLYAATLLGWLLLPAAGDGPSEADGAQGWAFLATLLAWIVIVGVLAFDRPVNPRDERAAA